MNIIMDFDGTIHDCAAIYVPAFRVGYKYLVDSGLMEYRDYPDPEIISYLGFSPKEMWNQFAPDIPDGEKKKVTIMVSDYMAELTENGKAVLYRGTEQALSQLKEKGHKLIFLSNCLHDYMELHRRVHGLDRFFSAYYCSEDFDYIPKPQIFEEIRKEHDGEFMVVGDRYFDLETAWVHGLPSVGCTYGYCAENELDRADILIGSISELPQAVDKIVNNIDPPTKS